MLAARRVRGYLVRLMFETSSRGYMVIICVEYGLFEAIGALA